MPVELELDVDRRLVRITYRDPVTFESWRQALDELFANPAYRPGFNFLVDRSGASTPTAEYARHIAAYLEGRRAQFVGSRVAIVVGDLVGYGMARMQEALNEAAHVDSRTFTDVTAALAWLEGETEGPGSNLAGAGA